MQALAPKNNFFKQFWLTRKWWQRHEGRGGGSNQKQEGYGTEYSTKGWAIIKSSGIRLWVLVVGGLVQGWRNQRRRARQNFDGHYLPLALLPTMPYFLQLPKDVFNFILNFNSPEQFVAVFSHERQVSRRVLPFRPPPVPSHPGTARKGLCAAQTRNGCAHCDIPTSCASRLTPGKKHSNWWEGNGCLPPSIRHGSLSIPKILKIIYGRIPTPLHCMHSGRKWPARLCILAEPSPQERLFAGVNFVQASGMNK